MRTRHTPKSSRLSALLIALLATVAVALPAGAQAAVPSQFWGVSATLPDQPEFGRMGGVGFGSYRFAMNWRNAQQTRNGPFSWGAIDYEVREAATAGMQPQPFMFGTPRFISRNAAKQIPPTGSQEDRQDWQEFLAAAARRYGPGGEFWQENPGVPARPITRWIIWNEQNAKAFWMPKPDPRDYATLIEISDRALSSVDPEANIVLGGMYGYPNDPNPSAVDFLRSVYKVKGIEDHFEAIGVHPYGAGVATVEKQIKQARTVAKKAGDPDVNILVGEIGWASTGPESAEEVVGSKGQANRLREGLRLLAKKRRSWNLVGAYVYVWRDFKVFTPCNWCPGAGLVEIDGTSKPALKSVRRTIKEFR